ncbi:MAG: hypothetical protein V3S14_01650 [Anaerolineae bacterium]
MAQSYLQAAQFLFQAQESPLGLVSEWGNSGGADSDPAQPRLSRQATVDRDHWSANMQGIW